MTLLMLDTSGPVCGVAVVKDHTLIYENTLVNKKTHSQKIMPMVDFALSMLDMTIQDVDVFGAVAGPGSFTGVRIGVATAKGLAMPGQKPCISVNALEALAMNIPEFDGIICPILDARAKQVYGAAYLPEKGLPCVVEPEAIALDNYLEIVRKFERRAVFLGDGAVPYREWILQEMGSSAVIAPAEHIYLRPGCAAMLADRRMTEGETPVDCGMLLPLYLRAPQAEREKAAREAQNRG